MAVELVGPFEARAVVVDGWRVPLLEAHPQVGGKVLLTLDTRFGLEVAVAELDPVARFLAHAIAVASGWLSHPNEDDEAPTPGPAIRPRRLLRLEAESEEPWGPHAT